VRSEKGVGSVNNQTRFFRVPSHFAKVREETGDAPEEKNLRPG